MLVNDSSALVNNRLLPAGTGASGSSNSGDASEGTQLANSMQGLAADLSARVQRLERVPEASMSAQVDYRESMTLNLMTQEGDRVQVKFGFASSAAYQQSNDGFALATDTRSGYQLMVKGDLNDAELDAINDLMDSVGELANDFFSGNLEDAFEQAMELEMDAGQLARMDLNLQMSARVEVQQYERINQLGAPERSLANQIQNWLEPVDLLSKSDILQQFAEPLEALRDLIESAIGVRRDDDDLPPGLSKALSERFDLD